MVGVDIGHAVELLREGQRVTRDGWNGKDMWLAYRRGYPSGVEIDEARAMDLGVEVGTLVKFRPYIAMMTAQGDMVPWVASQSDLLANDWREV